MSTDEPVKVLKGVNGQLSVFEDKVVITRKGALAKLTQGFFKGDKTIYINQITRGIMDATKDENTVMFNYRKNELVAEIKRYVENAMQAQRTSQTSSSVADEIIKLKSLLDEGILTQEEFDAQKKRLLS
jgi:hypothetical protein